MNLGLPHGVGLVLASASPRRAELLASVGLGFDVVAADIDESVRPGEPPAAYVARLSAEKARVVVDRLGRDVIVVAADTTVDVGDQILEKPVDDDDARRMLGLLSGRTHLVHTGVTVLRSRGLESGSTGQTIVVETVVEFAALTPELVEWYVATGEPAGKAGGYAIQGVGAALVRQVQGSVTNVIGLPLAETLDLLRRSA
jgi:septum formation protein